MNNFCHKRQTQNNLSQEQKKVEGLISYGSYSSWWVLIAIQGNKEKVVKNVQWKHKSLY